MDNSTPIVMDNSTPIAMDNSTPDRDGQFNADVMDKKIGD